MKYLRRFSLFVLSLVMFVGIFSTTAHAEEVKNFDVNLKSSLFNNNLHVYHNVHAFNYDENVLENWLVPSVKIDNGTYLELVYTIGKSDSSVIAKGGQTFNFRIDNIYTEFVLDSDTVGGSQHLDGMNNSSYSLAMVHTDGSYSYIYDIAWNFSAGNSTHNISVNLKPEKDVRKIVYTETIHFQSLVGDKYNNKYTDITFYFGGSNLIVTADIDSKEVGLLGGIFEKIKAGFDSIAGNFERMFSYIIDLVNRVKELPNTFKDMLVGLFVPDKENVQIIIDDFKMIVEDHFGLLYQVGDIIHSSWEGVKTAAQTDTISIPEATINFGDTPYTFGGYEVKIVPDGFSVIVNALKLIIGVLCTISFVNGIRNRYEEVMGVEK